MAITINGSGTITGISAGGLPDGSVTAADIESSLDLSGKTVTLPSGTGGKVLQVVQDETSTFVSTSTYESYVHTGLSASITPSSTSSKILILISHNGVNKESADTNMRIKLYKNGSDHKTINAFLLNTGDSSELRISHSYAYLDSPATTSAVTYATYFANMTGTGNVQMQRNGSSSTITLLEVAG